MPSPVSATSPSIIVMARRLEPLSKKLVHPRLQCHSFYPPGQMPIPSFSFPLRRQDFLPNSRSVTPGKGFESCHLGCAVGYRFHSPKLRENGQQWQSRFCSNPIADSNLL
jgi:hypothetical protein